MLVIACDWWPKCSIFCTAIKANDIHLFWCAFVYPPNAILKVRSSSLRKYGCKYRRWGCSDKRICGKGFKNYRRKVCCEPRINLRGWLLLSVVFREVWKKGQTAEDPLHILIKTFPANPARQSFFDLGLLPVELAAYEQVIPVIIQFEEGAGVEKKVRFLFAPYLGGQYIPNERRNG